MKTMGLASCATDAGVASWYDFAVAIQHYGCQLNLLGRSVPIVPITTAEFPTAARRPAYSVLDKSHTWKQFQDLPLHWQRPLYETLLALGSDGPSR
jgi:dTDP-4-dehydrorhamnose reductase